MNVPGLLYFFIACALATDVSAQTQPEAGDVLPPFQTEATAAHLDARKLQWYDSWVTQYPNDSPPVLETQDPEELALIRAGREAEELRLSTIRKDPKILPYLKAIFWVHHRSPDNNATGGVKTLLEAMTLKSELKESDVADITVEIERILRVPFSGHEGDHTNYLLKFYAQTLIPRFPTPANLDRLVRIITYSDSVDWYFAKVDCLAVLTLIGTTETLPLAEQTAQWLDNLRSKYFKEDFTHDHANEARRLVEEMKKRLASAPSPSTPSASASANFMQRRPLWLLAGLALLPVLFLVFRIRPRL